MISFSSQHEKVPAIIVKTAPGLNSVHPFNLVGLLFLSSKMNMLFSPQTNTLKRSNYLAVFSHILTSTPVCPYPVYPGDVLLHLTRTGGHVAPRTYIEPFSDSSSLPLPSMLSACSWHAQEEASLLICSGDRDCTRVFSCAQTSSAFSRLVCAFAHVSLCVFAQALRTL